ncbi:hypothetical protein [Paraburkholderia haematera]|uniref:LysR family transcriptional regulator n=1 Tax=Paraburkholderia haematera TaxID=2793077 RepID=A0ABM8REE7_9BURK|nr:hypothetical protein [Paraburkholderia haematera]CAE6748559.1 hypothetical protein R69888_02860 [Paraburkholderia haematera]
MPCKTGMGAAPFYGLGTQCGIPMRRVQRLDDAFDSGLVWVRHELYSMDNAPLYHALKQFERI